MNDHDHCPVCSALVKDLEAHENWHGELDQAIELAVIQQVVQAQDGSKQDMDGGTL